MFLSLLPAGVVAAKLVGSHTANSSASRLGMPMTGAQYVPGEVIVRFRTGVSASVRRDTLSALNGKVMRTSESGNVLVALPPQTSPLAAAFSLRRNFQVEYAEPNYIVRKAGIQAVSTAVYQPVYEPQFGEQWGLARVKAPEAWGEFVPSPDVMISVAVLDTGVDATHEELDDGRVLQGQNFTGIGDPMDTSDIHGHGTHVAGIIASEINGSGIAGIVGLADVKILPVKVLNDFGWGTVFGVAEGIRYASRHASILNMSLGGNFYSRTLAEAVLYAQGQGALIVAAAGNNFGPPVSYPAALPGVLAVSATVLTVSEDMYFDALAQFSSYGPEVDLAAPGAGILSAVPGNQYESWSGTSMAAPIVSGAAAFLMVGNPELTVLDAAALLKNNARDLGETEFDSRYGYGLLDMQAAFAAASAEQRVPVSLEWIYPATGGRLWGSETMDVQVSCAVYRVEFSVANVNSNAYQTIGEGSSVNDFVYRIIWDTAAKNGVNPLFPDGIYRLRAVSLAENGMEVGSSGVTVEVRNEANGLRAELRTAVPDVAPESGFVDVYEVVYNETTGTKSYQFVTWSEIKRDGRVWLEERIETEKRYLLVSQVFWQDEPRNPAAPWRIAMYMREVTAPFSGVIGPEAQTREITFSAVDADSVPLANAFMLLDSAIGLEYPLFAFLDSNGQTKIWLDEGRYRLALGSSSPNYFVADKDFVVEGETPLTYHFDTESTGILELKDIAGFAESWDRDLLLFPFLQDFPWAFGFLLNVSEVVYMSPGSYHFLADVLAWNEQQELWRYLFASTVQSTVYQGVYLDYAIGGSIDSDVKLLNKLPIITGDTLSTENVFTDVYQHRLVDGFRFTQADALAVLKERQVGLGLAHKDEAGEISRWRLDWKAQRLQAKETWEFAWIEPTLEISDDNSIIYPDQSGGVAGGNNLTRSWVHLCPEVFLLGEYHARLVANLGPLGKVESHDKAGGESFTVVETPAPAGVNATISPATAEYDLATRADVSTTIYWNDASAVQSVYLEVYGALELNTHYQVSEADVSGAVYTATLTILSDFIASLAPTAQTALRFAVNFNAGDPATFTVTVVDTLAMATAAVEAAESAVVTLTTQEEVDSAQALHNTALALVNALPDGASKNELLARLLAVQNAIRMAVRPVIEITVPVDGAIVSSQQEVTVSGRVYSILDSVIDRVYAWRGQYFDVVTSVYSDVYGYFIYEHLFAQGTSSTEGPFVRGEQLSGEHYTWKFFTAEQEQSGIRFRGQVAPGEEVTFRHEGYLYVESSWMELILSANGYFAVDVTFEVGDDAFVILAWDQHDNFAHAIRTFNVLPAPVSVTITQSATTVYVGQSVDFTATVGPQGADQGVTWSVYSGPGTISSAGVFSSPTAGTSVIRATSTVDSAVYGQATVVVVAPDPTPAPAPTPAHAPAPTPTPTPPAVVEQPIVAGQVTEVKLEGVIAVTVAAGAVTGEAPKITAQVMPEAAAAPLMAAAAGVGLTAASEVVVLTMVGGEFTAPVQLTLNFDTAKVATGQVPSVFVYNERTGRWIYLGGQVGEGTITVTVDRFSRFAVFATRPLPALADIADHWGRGSIRTLAGMGIVSGYADGNFKPGAAVTRAEFVSMLTRALGLAAKPEAAARFTDAAGWAQGAIGAAAEAGLVAGYADGTFGGSRRITRAEMAVILQRVIRKGLVPVVWTAGTDFADANALPAWAADSIGTASRAGMVRGFQDRTFRPGSTATRAETAAMLYRLVAER
jgi:hypothetical protein